MPSGLSVAVIEPTDLVGTEIIRLLEERSFPLAELVLLGGRRSAGEQVEYRGVRISVRAADGASFEGVDLAFFSCDRTMSEGLTGTARASRTTVIDLSSRHALMDSVPLVVPEVNADVLGKGQGIISCPRAATVELVLALAPIHNAARVRRVFATSFHPVSELGGQAMDELTGQVRDIFSFREVSAGVFPGQMAFNMIPLVSTLTEGGYTEEELIMTMETRKILRDQALRMSVTCVRVPVFYSHGVTMIVETERKIGPGEAREILEKAPGIAVQDEPAAGVFPTQVQAAGTDECLVGRIREDLGHDNGIALWAVCDNIRKGSALNAVQIAEHLLRTGTLG